LRRWFGALVALGALVGGPFAGPTGSAGADPMHRAAVIVEADGLARRIVVEFPEESISGIELLRRAGAEPVVYSYSGIGGAVCRLFGVGRDAGPECLGGTNGDARYWAYFRAPSGASSFRYAALGGGSTSVRDGDVEGWRYGTGAAPGYASIDSILGITPPPTTPPPTAIADAVTGGGVPGSPGTAASPDAFGVAPDAAPPGGPGPDDPVTDGTTDAAGGPGTGPVLTARPAVARRAAPERGSSRGPQSLVILALGLGGLGGWIAWARRSRRAAGAR
jgi:hypothetical protein